MGVRVISKAQQAELDVAPEDAIAGLQSGDFALLDDKVHVRREGNRTGTVAASELQRALAEGWQLSDAEANSKAKLRREEDSASGIAIGLVEQAAAGATLGLSSLAEEALGVDPERMAARAQATGGVGTAAELAGAIAPSLLTGGASAAGGVARAGMAARVAGALPAGAAVRAGQAVERGTAALLGTEAATGLGRAARVVIPRAAGQAVEGFAFGIGTELHESVLGQRDLAAERVLAGGLMSGALGGTVGLVMPGVTRVAAGAARVPARAVETVLRRFSGDAVESVARAGAPSGLASAMAMASGAPRELVEEGLGLIRTREGRRFATMGKIEHAEEIERLGSQIIKSIDSTNDAVTSALRATEGREYMRGVGMKLQSDFVTPRTTNAVLERMEAQIDAVAQKAERYADGDARAVLDEARELLRGGRASLEDASQSALQTMRRSDQMLRQISSIEQRARKARMQGFVADEALGALKTTRSMLKEHLEDERLWGEAGRLQKEGNALQHAALQARQDIAGKRNAAHRLLDRNEVSTAADAISVARRFGRDGPGSVEQGLDTVLQREIDYLEWVGRNREMPESFHASVRDAKARLDDLRGLAKTNRERLDASHVMARLRGYESGDSVSVGAASNMGATVGAVLGGTVAGPIGVAVGTVAGRAISSPWTSIRTMAGLLNLAEKAGLQVDGALGKFLARARGSKAIEAPRLRGPAAAAARRERRRSARAGAAVVATADRDRERQRTRAGEIKKRAAYLATTPGALAKELEYALLDARDVAPGVANAIVDKAQRGAMFLMSKVPPSYQPPFGNRDPIVDPVSAARFERYVETVENPAAVLERLADGSITTEHAEALRAVYPAIYSEVQTAIVDELAAARAEQREIPFEARLQLGLLFDVVSDPGLEPQTLADIQAVWDSAAAQEAGAPEPRVLAGPNPNISRSFSTPAQATERGLSKWA